MTHTEIRTRRRGGLLVAATLLTGVATAVIAAAVDPDFRDVLEPVQLAMSVLVPFSGVLAARRWRWAVGVAVAYALAGVVLAATATLLAGDAWPSASMAVALVVGSVLVQVIAQSVGTAAGLLIRRRALAMAATIVVPMSATVVLTVLAPGLVGLLTPYGNAQSLLAGAPDAAALVLVAMLWCVVPNAVARLTRSASHRSRSSWG